MKCPYCIKICTKCNRLLVANSMNFAKQKNGKYGYMSKCKDCKKKYNKHYYNENKEHLLENQKQYNSEHKEHKAEYMKQYYNENKEQIGEYIKQWRKDNPEYIKQYNKQYNSEHKDERAEYGKQWYKDNREQIAEQHKHYYNENKEHLLEQMKQWKEANPEYMKQWREDNREHKAEYMKQWREDNRELCNKYNHKRRALKAQNGGEYTLEQWQECLEFFDYKCAYSGKPINKSNVNVEHIIPISKGGSNNIYNIVPALDIVNKSKNASDMLEWYKEQPYYSEERLNKILDWIEYASNKYELNTISI